MKNFADALSSKIETLCNPTVIGLDPKLDYLPEYLSAKWISQSDDMKLASAMAIYDFNKSLIDAVYDIIPAIKTQFAYYEMYGTHGIDVLKKTIEYAKSKGMLVIADAKRNDIGSTAEAYANSILGKTAFLNNYSEAVIGADAITLNAYLGIDGIQPFIKMAKDEGKGLFILVRTSNPSAVDFQDLILKDGRMLYEAVATKVDEWGADLIGKCELSSVGAVVGATWPKQAIRLREIMPNALILVPGYGAQGGSADSAVCSFTASGKGAIVNASRSLMCAYKKRNDLPETQFAEATRDEAIRMRDDLVSAIYRRLHNSH